MTRHTIVAVYDGDAAARAAVTALEADGIPQSEISYVARHAGETAANTSSDRGQASGSEAGKDAGIGAAAGTGVGAVTGVLAGLGMLAIPGIGPIVAAGTLVTALTGAGVGAAAGAGVGGLVGSFTNAGISEEDANRYSEAVRRGGAAITVAADDNAIDRVRRILEDHHPIDLDEHEAAWRSSGWKAFDPAGAPYEPSATTGAQSSGTAGQSRLGTNLREAGQRLSGQESAGRRVKVYTARPPSDPPMA
jgi:hypothetical protein